MNPSPTLEMNIMLLITKNIKGNIQNKASFVTAKIPDMKGATNILQEGCRAKEYSKEKWISTVPGGIMVDNTKRDMRNKIIKEKGIRAINGV